VRIDRVLDWAARALSPASCPIRLLTVRRFALAMQAEDIRYEVPAADAVGRATFQRRSPHIYRAEEITELMRVAAQLKPVGSIRPLMYATVIGLLAATGIRDVIRRAILALRIASGRNVTRGEGLRTPQTGPEAAASSVEGLWAGRSDHYTQRRPQPRAVFPPAAWIR
jgi:integrase